MASASRKLLKDLPSEEEMAEIVSDLKSHGPQATAVMGAAYLEHVLEVYLRTVFKPLSKNDDTRMFDGAAGGILGGFSNKIRIAYAMGLIHENPYKTLLLINDIRNVFAHSLHKIDFENDLLAEDCERLASFSDPLARAVGIAPFSGEPPIEIYSKMVQQLYFSIRLEIQNWGSEAA
jgi:hypothetical protein